MNKIFDYIKEERKLIYASLIIGLLGLLVFCYFKSPLMFPGLEIRVLWALGIVGVIVLADLGYYLYNVADISRFSGFMQKVIRIFKAIINFCIKTKFVEYTFLFFLALVALASLRFEFMASLTDFLKGFSLYFTILAVVFGVIVFWKNRKMLLESMEKEKSDEENAEKKRYDEFDEKFPKLSKIWGLRSIVRWMYKEGWWYSSTVIILIIIGFCIRLYKLGALGLWWDELITGTYVTRIIETGLPLAPSGFIYYLRGIAYHYFVSFFTILFGRNEFWLRFPSVILGMGIVVCSFFFAKKINKKVAFAVLLFMVFSTYNLEYSRFSRFYIMNSFLFMIAIWFVWEGFFNNKLKYKILSILTFFIMLNVVQFGAIFMSLLATWGIYFILSLFFQKTEIAKRFKDNYLNFAFIALSMVLLWIFFFNNTFANILTSGTDLEWAINSVDVVPLASWNYLQFPEWSLLKFFNNYYLPLIFLAFFLITYLFEFCICLRKRDENKLNFLSYLGAVFIISVLLYELGSRGVGGARIFLFAEPLVIMLFASSLYLIVGIVIKNYKIRAIFLILFIILFSLNITPNFYNRLNLNYGDNVSDDPFRTTEVAAYRADYKTTYLYLKENIQDDDMWIALSNNNYFNLNSTPDYILRQSIRWNTLSLFINESFVDPITGALIINDAKSIEKIIADNPNRRIWIVVNGGSINILHTIHIEEDTLNFLKKNEDKVMYLSPDKISRVLLFEPKIAIE